MPIEFYIFISAIIGAIIGATIGATIGYLTAAFFAGAARTRIERATWNQARLFYEARARVDSKL